jgi:beta-glucosidase
VAWKEEAEGAVLLKNRSHFLPRPLPQPGQLIVVVGPMATPATTGGGGSSYVIPIAGPVSLLDAVRKVAAGARVVDIPYLDRSSRAWQNTYLYRSDGKRGCRYRLESAEQVKSTVRGTLPGVDFRWPAGGPAGVHGGEGFTGVFRTTLRPKVTGEYMLKFFCTAGAYVYINHDKTIEQWRPRPVEPFLNSYHLVAGKTYHIKIELDVKPLSPLASAPAGFMKMGVRLMNHPLLTSAQQALIRRANLVIAGVGFGPRIEHEDLDRSFDLPSLQGRYLKDVGHLNPHTVVVLDCGGPVGLKPWINHIDALIDAWYPGENGNLAVADIIFGKLNPSGHLPVTFSWSRRQEPAYGHYPGHDILGKHPVVHFAEGIFIGYRWFNKHHITPAFPFGYGLSYTHFTIKGLGATSIGHGRNKQVMVLARITNIGKRRGADAVQLYVKPPPGKLVRVVQKLEGFQRVNLEPGESRIVHLNLNWRSFACFDTKKDKWIVPAGKYRLVVGDSSARTTPAGSVIFH